MTKRHTRHKSQRRSRNKSRRRQMKGGAFTQDETQQLLNNGFIQPQIEGLNNLGVTFNEAMQALNTIVNNNYPDGFHGNSDDMEQMAEQAVTQLMNEHIFNNPNAQPLNIEPIPQAADYNNNFNYHDDDDNDGQNSLHLSDLDVSQHSEDGYTTNEEPDDDDVEWGGKIKSRKNRKHKKHNKKGRKTRKNRKHRQKGGRCYGNGVGANSYEPNYSIYNTNALKLFPYKP